MSDRFNFFDVFGYLLPGTLLLILLWLPYGLLLGEWPPADWGTAGIALAIAYIAGHLIYRLSDNTFNSKFWDGKKKELPSHWLLEKRTSEELKEEKGKILELLDTELSNETIDQITGQVHLLFRKDVTNKIERAVAFFQCRNYLLQKGAAAYAQQMQGMYVLLRGVFASFLLAAGLYLGLALTGFAKAEAFDWVYLSLLVWLVVMLFLKFCLQKGWEKWAFWTLVFSLVCCGFLSQRVISLKPVSLAPVKADLLMETNSVQFEAKEHAISRMELMRELHEKASVLAIAMALVAILLAMISYFGFRYFAVQFAATVYRDFNALAPLPEPSDAQVLSYAAYLRQHNPGGTAGSYNIQARVDLKQARDKAITPEKTD